MRLGARLVQRFVENLPARAISKRPMIEVRTVNAAATPGKVALSK